MECGVLMEGVLMENVVMEGVLESVVMECCVLSLSVGCNTHYFYCVYGLAHNSG